LDAIIEKHGGLILGVDALQPEGHGSLQYVLYEILSGRVVSAIQMEPPNEKDLTDWHRRYQGYPVMESVSDGEERILAAIRAVWPNAPRQRCQEHFWGNLAEEVLENDAELRKQMRVDCPQSAIFALTALFSEPNQDCGSRACERVTGD
jgi:hypothetical protein